jgi:predicted nucleic-acid-binding Zn-ribbon protein
MKICSKCQSDKIIQDAFITGYEDSGFRLGFNQDSNAAFFKKTFHTDVKVLVCGECGFIEFYAAEAKKLYEAVLKSRKA